MDDEGGDGENAGKKLSQKTLRLCTKPKLGLAPFEIEIEIGIGIKSNRGIKLN
jgi:hypothetical protein